MIIRINLFRNCAFQPGLPQKICLQRFCGKRRDNEANFAFGRPKALKRSLSRRNRESVTGNKPVTIEFDIPNTPTFITALAVDLINGLPLDFITTLVVDLINRRLDFTTCKVDYCHWI